MSLADVNEDLHRRSREAEPVLPGDPDPIIQPKSVLPDTVEVNAPVVPLGVAWGGKEKRDEPIAPGMQPRNPLTRLPKKVVILSGVIALALFAAGLFFKAGGWLFTPENVRVTVTGPKRAESNESVEYVIRYENNNWVDLDEAELIISYPEFFQLETSDGFQVSGTQAVLSLGTVKKSSLNSVTIKGSFRSLQDQVALFTATLRAAPSGVSSRVDTEYQYSIAVESSAIIVELSVPPQAGDGQFADFVATYRNESPETVENLSLVIEYPEGFTYRDATPVPSKDSNHWNIRSLAPGESGTVSARGILSGAQGDVKRTFAKVGVQQGDGSILAYAIIERQTRMAASPLAILQKFGDGGEQQSVAPGETLSHRILFRNDGDVGLRDLIVTIDLNPKYFDVTKLDLRGGTYNVQKQQVVFRAADRPVLSLIEPGQRGEIGFAAPIRSDLAQYKQNNIEIESIARIDSPDVPTPVGANKIIASNRAVFKIRTAPEFEVKGYHFDGYGNTGPVPLVVGQETQFTINVRVGSTINALEDVQVGMTVPGQVRYIKTQAVNRGSVTYNDRTGEIFWNVGTISPGTEQAAQLAIQIGITPDPTQFNAEAVLVNSVKMSSRDTWTGDGFQRSHSVKTINLLEDEQFLGMKGNKVVANDP